MAAYSGTIELIGGLMQKNGGDFPLMDASAIQVDNDGTRLSEKLATLGGSSAGGRPVIYCWGDSLTEGVGGWIMPPDGHNAYMGYSYPEWLSQTFDVVNLGARSENVPAIMARQGADPVVLQTALSIPASKATPVLVQQVTQIYDGDDGDGFVTRSGQLVKWNKEVESAGLNPCVIGGVEGILYRELAASGPDNESTYNYYFKRLKDGDAVTAAAGSTIETFAMRYYRNGIAVIWMGANGGGGSASAFTRKIEQMVDYGNYDNYLVIISREYSGADLETIKTTLTDENGFCHVISLVDELPYRGYMMAGIGRNSVDTSGWETTDVIKKSVPLLCEYLSGQTGENMYGALHYSIWGYKAIGKLVQEKLHTMGLIDASNSQAEGKTKTYGTDEYGYYLYKLPEPKQLSGTNYVNTKIKLFEDVTRDWTIVCKWDGDLETDNGNNLPYNIFSAKADGEGKGTGFRYWSASAANLYLGPAGINVYPEDSEYNDNNANLNVNDTNIVIIIKSGNYYKAYVNNTTMVYGGALNYPMSSADAHSLPVVLGARWNAEGEEIQLPTKVRIVDFRIYDDALEESDALALYAELLL